MRKFTAMQFIIEGAHTNHENLEKHFSTLHEIACEGGLAEDDIEQLVDILVQNKLASSFSLNLFKAFIPTTTVSKITLEKILSWLFTKNHCERLTKSVERKCLQWLTGITYYELGDITVINAYYHAFLFLMKTSPHLESTICHLLCLLSKPEDAKRWIVKQILDVQKKSGPKLHTSALISILKSYRPDIVPEQIASTSFDNTRSTFDAGLQKAHTRKLNSVDNRLADNEVLNWKPFKVYNKKTSMLARLVPTAESVSFDSSISSTEKYYSIMEFKTMASLGTRPLQIRIPAQTLSLLANEAGYHVLAFSDEITQARFSHKLYYTLFRVFVLELEPYTEEEKQYLLDSLFDLEEYMQQSIPVVTKFLFRFLLIWDGDEFREQILGLLQWISISDVNDWSLLVFRPLRVIFRSSGRHFKWMLIRTMSKMVRNIAAVDKRESELFLSDFQQCDTMKSIEALADFVGEIVVEGLTWSTEEGRRELMTASLDFYETCQAACKACDLPTLILPPPALIYNCLFSHSRLCIARLCALLISYKINTIQVLYSFGVAQDFALEIEKLKIYILDCYRCLWNRTDFQQHEDSFLFHDKDFCAAFSRFRESFGANISMIYSVKFNAAFWDNETKGLPENIMNMLAIDYPSILTLRNLVEEKPY